MPCYASPHTDQEGIGRFYRALENLSAESR